MTADLPLDRLPVRRDAPLDLLTGTHVLDLCTSVAGPYAGQLLADLGADVVKVERPGRGDDARAWGPPFLDGESLWFLAVNRGKRSIVVDTTRDGGHDLLMQLVRHCDVLLLNQPRRVQHKLGLDSATLRAQHPRLVHVSITGFGTTGARADLPCYDLVAEGYSGVMDLTGEADSGPQKVGTPAADLLAGQDAAMAALAALVRRQRTGEGCEVDVSMVESMSRFMAPRVVPYLGSGTVPRRSGARDSVIAVYQVFDTADEPMTLGLGNDEIWQRFWDAVGQPDAGRDAQLASNAARRERRAEIVARIADLLRTRPRAQWLQVLQAARVPCGPIQRVDQVAADTHLLERGLLYAIADGDRRVPQVGLGIRFDGRGEGTLRAPPRLGADTEAVLRDWIDADGRQLRSWRDAGLL